MDKSLQKLLDDNRDNAAKQYQLAGICSDTVKDFVLREMALAIEADDQDVCDILLGIVYAIDDPQIKADTLNNLLVMPGHHLHQEITMEIQKLGNPSSVCYIRTMLESNFATLEYTCSEPEAIAKWFSHALARINTTEANQLIEEFSRSSDPGVAREMAYRLARINARHVG